MDINELNTPSKIDLRFAEEGIVFLFCDCSLHKYYSFYGLNREEATKLILRLKHIEKYTWKQFASLDRADGLTSEKSNTESFDMIHEQSSFIGNVTEQHYFHFRVEKTNLFRVFGYQKNRYFCITHIDPDGRIQHS